MSYKSFGASFLIIAFYLTCAWCTETEITNEKNETELVETGRRRHGFGLHKLWGFYGIHALSVLYWLKVKAVIVAFLVGTALVWGFKYYKSGYGCPEIIRESPPISYDHGPAWSGDHIPYSLDHNPFEHEHVHEHSHDHDHFSSPDVVSVGETFPGNEAFGSLSGAYSEVAPSGPAIDDTNKRRRARQIDSEEQVSDIVFAFLGITNNACRRRFICEMEFRSKINPFTRIAFGIVGRGLFSRYVNNKNENGRAASFRQCADVNPDCILIEENINNNEENEVTSEYEGRDLNTSASQNENNVNLQTENKTHQRNSKTSKLDPIANAILFRSQAKK